MLRPCPVFPGKQVKLVVRCHTQSFGPNLTPFGRDFKLGGYTMGGGSGKAAELPKFGGMVQGSFTNTQKDQTVQSAEQPDAALRPTYSQNNNVTFDQASVIYAGRIYGKVGAFSQLTYNGYDKKFEMDNTDIRFADQLDLDSLDRLGYPNDLRYLFK